MHKSDCNIAKDQIRPNKCSVAGRMPKAHFVTCKQPVAYVFIPSIIQAKKCFAGAVLPVMTMSWSATTSTDRVVLVWLWRLVCLYSLHPLLWSAAA